MSFEIELAKRKQRDEELTARINAILDEREQEKRIATSPSNAIRKTGPTKADLAPYAAVKLRSMNLGDVVEAIEEETGVDMVGRVDG